MKLTTFAASVGGLFVLGAAGATVYSGHAAGNAIDQLIAESNLPQSSVQLEVIERSDSFTSSSGVFRVSLNAECFQAKQPLTVPALVKYTINHLPGSSGFSRYKAHLELEGEAGDMLISATGEPIALTVVGALGFSSKWSTQLATPKIDYVVDDQRIKVAASQGEFVGSANSGAFAWKLPTISVSSKQGGVEITGISMAGHFEDIDLALGQQTFAIENIETHALQSGPNVRVNGLRFDYETQAQNGLVSTAFKPSVTEIDVAGRSYQDLSLTMTLAGMDEVALRDLNAASSGQCQSNMQDEQLRQIEESLLRLIDRGVSFSISELKGRQGDDRFGGELQLLLTDQQGEATGTPKSLAERVSASANVKISQGLIPEPFQEMVLGQGFGEVADGSLKSSLSFGAGGLIINGEPDESGLFDTAAMFLAIGDESLSGWHEQIAQGNGPLVTLARASRLED